MHQGLTNVYHNGYFFFPTDVTPGENDFQISGQDVTADIHGATHDADPYTIHVVYAPDVCFTASDVTVVQGSRTTAVGKARQALLRAEVNPTAPCHPTSFTVNVTGAANLENVEAWLTTADQLYAEGVAAVRLGTLSHPAEGANTIVVDTENTSLLATGEHNYIWITADICNDITIEANEVDAALTTIGYENALPKACEPVAIADGNPDGTMRIFLKQDYLWVSTDKNSDVSRFYRNPVILSLGDGNVLAFSEYRYDDVSELGRDYDDSGYGHRIDIVMRKSVDNGETWSEATTIASGTSADEGTKASGFSKPAVAYVGGKVICLMAMGSDAYDSSTGLRHIGMTTSTDQGATWSAVTDIYDAIDWGEHSPSSAYITAGKGVTFSNGRVAFVLNERNGSQTNEYVLCSDDEGATWELATDMVFGNGKEAKLLVMNDNKLLATISRGLDENLENRGYAYTTGNALATGINTWGTSGNWGSLNSYGRNNDILYYGRGTNGFATTDVVLHTVYNGTSSEEALRLYASFDQAATWNEFFNILPANAGVSSMQRLSDGNLAIAFEDGSIGGGANGSYALNYVVIHGDIFQMQVSDLMSSYPIKEGETNGSAPFVTWATSGWTKSFTTTAASGFAGVVVESAYSGAFNREGNGTQRVLDLKVSAVNTSNTITITAPDGFIIKSYTLKGYNKDSETYTLSADGVSDVVLSGGKASPATFTKTGVDDQTTTFAITSSGSSASYAQFIEFKVELAPGYYTVPLNKVNANGPGDTKSYATLYAPFDLTISDNETKAYYVTMVSDGKARLTETADIPKLTAVLLVNSGGNDKAGFNVTKGLESVVSADDNLLKGTLVPLAIDLTETSPNYSFGRYRENTSSPYVAGFYKYDSSSYEMGANHAWLEWSDPSAGSRGLVLSFGDDAPTAVLDLNDGQPPMVQEEGNTWYSLDGRRLCGIPVSKGVYVSQGKKFVVK